MLQVAGPVVTMRQRHYLLSRDTAEPVSWESLAFERWLRSLDDTDLPFGSVGGPADLPR